MELVNTIIAFLELISLIVLGALNVWILLKLNKQNAKTAEKVNDSNEKFTKDLNDQNIENQKLIFEQNKNIMLYEHRLQALNSIFDIYLNNATSQNFATSFEKGKNLSNPTIEEIKLVMHSDTNIYLEKDDEHYYKLKSTSEIIFDSETAILANSLYELNANRRKYFNIYNERIFQEMINTLMNGVSGSIDEMFFKINSSSPEIKQYFILCQELMQETNKFETHIKKFIANSVN